MCNLQLVSQLRATINLVSSCNFFT